MKLQRYVIEQLLGMQPWRSPGSSEVRPTLLERLSFSRPEGYEPAPNDTLDYANAVVSPTVSPFDTVAGQDAGGLTAIRLAADTRTVALLRDGRVLGSDTAGAFAARYVPHFGVYRAADGFVGVNANDVVFSDAVAPDITLTFENDLDDAITSSSEGAIDGTGGSSGSIVILKVISTPAGRLVVGTQSSGWVYDRYFRIQMVAPAEPADLPGLQYEVYIAHNITGVSGRNAGSTNKSNIDGIDYVLSTVVEPGETTWLTIASVGRVLPDTGHVATSGVDGPTALHGGRTWYVPYGNGYDYIGKQWMLTADRTEEAKGTLVPRADLSRAMVLAYSEIGYVNLTGVTHYLFLPRGSSTQITGMLSTPNGLMVFGENDAYMISGDPALDNLQVDTFPDTIGCDAGFAPVSLGGRIFTLWQGRLYMLEGANATDVSRGVLDGADEILALAADATRACVALLTPRGLLRFDVQMGEWYLDTPLAEDYVRTDWPSGSAVLSSPTGLRFFDAGGARVLAYVPEASLAWPYTIATIEWRDLDAGEPLRRDYWRSLRIPIDIRPEFGFASVPPDAFLYYRVRDDQPDVADENNAYRVQGIYGDGELSFALPWGHTGRRIDLRLVLYINQRVTIQPGLSVGFSPGPEGGLIAPEMAVIS